MMWAWQSTMRPAFATMFSFYVGDLNDGPCRPRVEQMDRRGIQRDVEFVAKAQSRVAPNARDQFVVRPIQRHHQQGLGAQRLDRDHTRAQARELRSITRRDGLRSEERRGGEEGRSRWSPYH